MAGSHLVTDSFDLHRENIRRKYLGDEEELVLILELALTPVAPNVNMLQCPAF